ncbi:MAG: 1-acyl-sn-glycerol-3-phosphate acyltransferase [Bacteroidetes bacterium]|nr:1-acyl-sn-glycerol-3-phosphate acyltransferase [Bacteroidota bacterium]
MLYPILKILFRLTFKVFFRKTFKHHASRVPAHGPLLICANHPGAFLDPIVIASLVNRKVFFLAKGSVFKGGFAKWFLPKLNVIPVYRAQDDPTQMHKNQETFIRCFEHLGKGGTILIFPEGISITERKLRPLKTGAARIAIGAEEKYGSKLNVHIQCVGLNYEDPHTFRRDVFVGFAEPIRVNDFIEENKTQGFEAAEKLTEEIRIRLEEQMIVTSDPETDLLVKNIERLYKYDLMKQQHIDAKDKTGEFELTKRIVKTVNYFREKDPGRVINISGEIKQYFSRIDELGLSDRMVKSDEKRKSIFSKAFADLLLIITGFPFYLYGILHNYLPFIGASWLSKNLIKQVEWRGAIGAAAGMVFFIIWYTTLGFFSWYYFHKWEITSHPGWMFLLYFISWPATGLFAWLYYRTIYYISKRWLMVSLFFRRTAIISELVLQRKKLIGEFEKAIEERGPISEL